MAETFERFHAVSGGISSTLFCSNRFTNAGRMLVMAQYRSDGRARGAAGQQRIADAFTEMPIDWPTLSSTLARLRREKTRSRLGGRIGLPRARVARGHRRQSSAISPAMLP
jgi:hypothetical protein